MLLRLRGGGPGVQRSAATCGPRRPDLLDGDVAILGEPTGGAGGGRMPGHAQAGRSRLAGRRAHTARPWTGVTPSTGWAPLLRRRGRVRSRTPVLDGCEYREALQAVAVEGGVAANVVPDEASVTLNHRFAPDRDEAAAEAARPASCSRPCLDRRGRPRRARRRRPRRRRPASDHPVLARLVAATGRPPGPSWGGPTWPSSPSTASRPPTSGRAIPHWPTPRPSTSTGATSKAVHGVLRSILG